MRQTFLQFTKFSFKKEILISSSSSSPRLVTFPSVFKKEEKIKLKKNKNLKSGNFGSFEA